MLDKMLKGVLARLEANSAAVIAQQTAIERERAGDEARDHAGRMLESPEGYSYTPSRAYQKAQKDYAKARRDWEEKGLGALELFATLMIARERRDEAKAWFHQHASAAAHRQTTGIHPEIVPFFALMFEQGVEPRHLANVRQALMAIICDMLRWDGHDPDMTDPTSPIAAIFAIYAERLLLVPGQFGDRSRSVPGVAMAPVRQADPRYYMFGDLVPPPPAHNPQDIVINQAEGSDGEVTHRPPEVRHEPTVEQSAMPICELSACDDTVTVLDEYALPASINADDAETLLRGAEQWVRSDYDWEDALKAATGYGLGDAAQIIARAEAAREQLGDTPLRYFVEAAKLEGVDAGWAAYRAATIRRMAHSFATKVEWKDVRANLGLDW